MRRTHWNILLLNFILASLILDFTAAYIIRWAIHDLYINTPSDKTSMAITLIDKLSMYPLIFHYAIGIAIGIVFMSALVWGLQFGIKEQ
jgi:hypothetical protein